MSKTFIIANWKSHKTASSADEWFHEFQSSEPAAGNTEVLIAPPTSLLTVVAQQKNKAIKLCAQDVSPFPQGAYTGADSAQTLKSLGVEYCLVGHSERRRYFHENDQDVAKKVEQCVANEITPIVCVDEPYLASQAKSIEAKLLEKCLVAYEPLNAIGTGNESDVGTVKKVSALILQHFGDVAIIYGGSVSAENCRQYFTVTQGVLVGSKSLQPKDFSAIVMASKV